MYVQPLEGSLSANSPSSLTGTLDGEGVLDEGGLSDSAVSTAAGDNISRFLPPSGLGESPASMQGMFGSLMSVLTQMMQMLQSMMGYGGCNERFFANATASSEGDPHLSFDGNRWSNMASQPNLLSSNSIPGGFQISTQVSAPNARGVTWNQSATIALNNGATTIGLNSSGQPAISSDGQPVAIAPGQTLQLGNGETVSYGQNGSLRVTVQNGSGGQIATTLAAQGRGVNVDVTAHEVNLAGALVDGGVETPDSNELPKGL
jgi:hypothetical protein